MLNVKQNNKKKTFNSHQPSQKRLSNQGTTQLVPTQKKQWIKLSKRYCYVCVEKAPHNYKNIVLKYKWVCLKLVHRLRILELLQWNVLHENRRITSTCSSRSNAGTVGWLLLWFPSMSLLFYFPLSTPSPVATIDWLSFPFNPRFRGKRCFLLR